MSAPGLKFFSIIRDIQQTSIVIEITLFRSINYNGLFNLVVVTMNILYILLCIPYVKQFSYKKSSQNFSKTTKIQNKIQQQSLFNSFLNAALRSYMSVSATSPVLYHTLNFLGFCAQDLLLAATETLLFLPMTLSPPTFLKLPGYIATQTSYFNANITLLELSFLTSPA